MRIKPREWLSLTEKQQFDLLKLGVMMNKPGQLKVKMPASVGRSEQNQKIFWINSQCTKNGHWEQ